MIDPTDLVTISHLVHDAKSALTNRDLASVGLLLDAIDRVCGNAEPEDRMCTGDYCEDGCTRC